MAMLSTDVFWLLLSGVIFFVMALLFFAGPFQKDRSELMQGFLGFLGGMAWFHLLMAGGIYWGNTTVNTLAAFGAVTGSAFLLKFPLLSFSNEAQRKNLFHAVLAVGWLIVGWLLVFPHDPKLAMVAGSVYMIIVSGAISGSYIIWKGLHLKDPALKVKCIGGGCSIVICCFLTHLIVLTVGMTVLAKAFMVLTPIALIVAVYLSRALERKTAQ